MEFDVNWIYSIRREIVGDEVLSSNAPRSGWKLSRAERKTERERERRSRRVPKAFPINVQMMIILKLLWHWKFIYWIILNKTRWVCLLICFPTKAVQWNWFSPLSSCNRHNSDRSDIAHGDKSETGGGFVKVSLLHKHANIHGVVHSYFFFLPGNCGASHESRLNYLCTPCSLSVGSMILS